MQGGGGQWTRFVVDAADESSSRVTLYAPKAERWLTVEHTGQFGSSESPVALQLNTCPSSPLELPEPAPAPLVDHSVLSSEQLAQFHEDGFLILPEAVPQHLVQECLRSINKDLGSGYFDPANMHLSAQLAKDVMNCSPRFWSALNLLLGEGNVRPPRSIGNRGPQVALRFPENRQSVNAKTYHIDGMNGDNPCGFTLLCGVALSDQATPDMGNLHVFPKSHLDRSLRQYYIDHAGESDVTAQSRSDKPYVGEPLQVLLNPGDVVIAHQMLAHAVGRNASPNIRYQLYYRVRRKRDQYDAAFVRDRIVEDPWVEYNDGAVSKKPKLV